MRLLLRDLNGALRRLTIGVDMFGVGMGELVIVFLAIFLLFGPEALPEIAKTIGRFLAKVKNGLQDFEQDIRGGQKGS